MNEETFIPPLFQALVAGDRTGARAVIAEMQAVGTSPEDIAHDVFWPVLETINSLHRSDKLTTLAHHYAVRLLRLLIDQAQAGYEQQPRNGRRVLMFSGTSEADELAGQFTADLVEAAGYEVHFGGGGVANDEILAEIGERRPDVLLMFASSPSDAPNVRVLIDTIRSVGSCPWMQIVVGGGVFNRADGLAEEIGADLWAKKPRELIERLDTQRTRRATHDQRTVGRNRRAPDVGRAAA
jgi:methanogenic corrinoid protein MtbC1